LTNTAVKIATLKKFDNLSARTTYAGQFTRVITWKVDDLAEEEEGEELIWLKLSPITLLSNK
jgi:hypothetical protein